MIHINVDTNDLFWATAIAGVALNAASKNKINPPFKLTFQPTTPEIAQLASVFQSPGSNMETFKIPQTEEEFKKLDILYAKKTRKEVKELYNVAEEGPLRVNPAPISHLVPLMFLLQFQILGDANFYYPRFQKKDFAQYTQYHAVASGEKIAERAVAWLQGYGIIDPKVLDIDTLEPLEAIKAACNPELNLAALSPDHYLIPVFRSFYKGFDFLSETVPILVVLTNDTRNSRHYMNWQANIPIHEDDDLSAAKQRGHAWRIRSDFKFDHNAYRKQLAMEKKNEQSSLSSV
jgi:hypothetical protein